jgi:hypothetical protein
LRTGCTAFFSSVSIGAAMIFFWMGRGQKIHLHIYLLTAIGLMPGGSVYKGICTLKLLRLFLLINPYYLGYKNDF